MSKTFAKRLKAMGHRVAMLEKENRFLTRSAMQRSGEVRTLQELLAVRESMLGILAAREPDGVIQMKAIDIVLGRANFRIICALTRETPEGNATLNVRRIRAKQV